MLPGDFKPQSLIWRVSYIIFSYLGSMKFPFGNVSFLFIFVKTHKHSNKTESDAFLSFKAARKT